MGTLTIRNLDDAVKRELRKRAAERGVSMEQEARDTLARGIAT
jgi:plasmid stability protein